MRAATQVLQDFLNSWDPSIPVQMADLYTFTLSTGEVFWYSGFQSHINAPAPNSTSPVFHYTLGPRFNRTKIKTQTGPEIDELEIEIFVGDEDILGFNSGGTLTWQSAFSQGLFDGGYCELQRAFIQGPVVPGHLPFVVGTITWFYGRIGDIEIGRTRSIIRVKSLLDLLSTQMPRRLFQAGCTHIFGQPGFGMCGYDRVNGLNALGVATGIGQQTITCLPGSSSNAILTSFIPGIPGSYDNGSIIGVTGLNAGFTRTIAQLTTSGLISTMFSLKPWIFAIVPGVDEFQLLPGCDHTLTTCTNVFQNQARFGGFPFIPPPETAI